MADFRRLLYALFAVALLLSLGAPAANADAFTCNGNAGSPVLVRGEGITELVGDIVMNCTGGTPTAGNIPIPESNVTIFLSTPNLTSRLYAGNLSEAVLTIDEPFPLGTNVPSNTTPGATVATAPLGCLAINGTNCAILGTGGGLGTVGPYNGSPGHYNVFQGFQNTANSVAFNGVPIDAPGTFGTRVIRITNVRADVTGVGLSAVPLPVTATITVNGSQQIIINNPSPTVANVVQGLIVSNTKVKYVQCLNINGDLLSADVGQGPRTVTVNVTEGFAASFKERNYAQHTGGTIAVPLPPSTLGYQNVLGFPYNTESGYVSATPGLSNPGLGNGAIGLADQGTQFQAAITNIGAGIHIFAPNKVIMTNVPGTTNTGVACLVGSNCTGASTEIPVAGTPGVATATYEVWLDDPNVTETAAIAFNVAAISNTGAGQPGVGISQVTVSFAPISSVHTASTSAPIPRFVVGTAAPKDFFEIDICACNLLFPFVTNIAGYDTGVAIANTSMDPFGTPNQQGTVTLNYYNYNGGTSPPPQTTSDAIPAGQQLVFVLSGGGTHGILATAGFEGYIIAQSNFQYCHGFAFISDMGAQKLAEGYLAIQLDEAVLERTGIPGENKAH